MLQVVASPMAVILATLVVSYMLLDIIYSTGITHDDHHLRSAYFYSTGHRLPLNTLCDVKGWVLRMGYSSWSLHNMELEEQNHKN
jgi:hypothetical protein